MSTTALKLIALVFMLVDHTAEFLPGIPVWFHWLGRLSASLFLFCMAWGFHYTRDRKKYLLRLYSFGVLMGIINLICNNVIDKPYRPINNNIFVTLFSACLVIWLIEYRRNNKEKGTRLILLFTVIQVVSTIIGIYILKHDHPYGLEMFVGAITGNLIFNEGILVSSIFGVLLYFNRESKKKTALVHVLFTVLFFIMTPGLGFSMDALFMKNYQWMMIACLPFMLLYNGKKGSGLKYLFYIFYPVHILILFLIGNFYF